MEESKVKAMFELAKKLDNFQLVLLKKCEICGPLLRGADKSKYPKCKKHNDLH
jgi:hypothetical protein